MDNLSEKLAGILNDPASMEQFRKMAEGLLGSSADPQPAASPPPSVTPPLPDIGELGGIVQMLSMLKTPAQDNRTALITALRPHLSAERQKRADRAIKILRILDILPLLKESGLLEKLL